MTCAELSELMSAALDRPPDERVRSALRSHLDECQECRYLWQALQDVDRLFRAAPLATAPPGFTARVVAAAVAHKRRDSFVLGAVAVLWGAFVVLVLALLSLLGVSDQIISFLGMPSVLIQAPQWLSLAGEVLLTLGEMTWSMLWMLRELVAIPVVALALIMALSSGLVVLVILMRTGERPAPSLL
jgi:anti-sigma factor RsiW